VERGKRRIRTVRRPMYNMSLCAPLNFPHVQRVSSTIRKRFFLFSLSVRRRTSDIGLSKNPKTSKAQKLSISPGTLCAAKVVWAPWKFIRKAAAAKEEKRDGRARGRNIMYGRSATGSSGEEEASVPHEIQNDRYDVIKILLRLAGHARGLYA